MKPLFTVGLIVLILGIISFFVPVPHSEHHGVSAGDVHMGSRLIMKIACLQL